MGPIEAIKTSGAITKGSKWDLLLFVLFVFVINLVGAVFLGVGLFITVPITSVATAFIYQKLANQLALKTVEVKGSTV